MNYHLSNIASALCTTQQHAQPLMNREMKLDDQKIGLLNEVMSIPGISKDDAIRDGRGVGIAIPAPIPIFKSYPHTHTHTHRIFKIYPYTHTHRVFQVFGYI